MPKPSTTTHLQCLQVWGGTEAAEQTLRMTGLDGYLYARPHEGATRGGDVYYISSCASGRITRVLIADVAGHGSRVAETAQDLRSLMQRYVNFTSQQRFMQAMNQKFSAITEAGRFATTVAMSYFAPTRKLSLSNAGHPPPMWYRAKTKRWQIVGVDPGDEHNASADLPFGVEDDAPYQQVDLKFEPGDRLLMYTDALIETSSSDGRLLGVRGLLDRLNSLDAETGADVIPRLIERLTQDDDQDLRGDDLTVLMMQSNGTKGEWFKTMMGPVNIVRGLFRGVPVGV